jgi:hypothetical protein
MFFIFVKKYSMKNLYIFLLVIAGIVFVSGKSYSQCTPDPSCNDTLDPGEICPETLPDGTVGVAYDQVVTIIPPASGDIGSGTVSILKIKISNVQNLPDGLTYACTPTNCEFPVTNPITRYCVRLSGTPTTAGVYPLKVYVIPYISVGGFPVPATTQIDSTSLSITINTAGSVSLNSNKIVNIDPKPNPFSNTTQLGFVAYKPAQYELQVFDIVGNRIHSEKKVAVKGENYFEFSGNKLSKGMYIYTIQNGQDKITRQLVKQ